MSLQKTILAASAVTGAVLFASNQSVSANTDDKNNEHYQLNQNNQYEVQSGDTLNEVAEYFGTTADHLAQVNNITDKNLIFVEQKLTIDTAKKAAKATAPVVSSTVVEPAQSASQENSAAASTSTASYSSVAGNDRASLRRQIESGDNYQTFTGNGYYGAYQFAPTTWAAGVAAVGGSVDDFSAEHQDAVANWYADARYGGWENVPTVGGW